MAEVLEPRTLPTAEVSGIAFIDANTNGTRDANEILIRGVPLSLTGQTTDGVNVQYTTKTDANGAYEFPDVLPGTYSLTAGTTQNVTGTTPDINDFPVEDGETITQNLPFSGQIPASALSLRQFLTTAPLVTSITEVFAPAAERENSLPEFQEGNEEINIGKNDTETIVDLAGLFTDSDYTNSQVKIKTSMGNFNVELFDEQTPQTVANFFNYVKEDRYDNTFFHRLVSGFVLQGGGFAFDDSANTITHIDADPPVENEFSVTRSNIRGTIAMAKVGGDPNSATSEFFINLGNNAANLDNQNGGFTVFGKLVAAADQTVVDTLAATTIRDQSTTNGALNEIPLKNYSGPNDDPNFLTAAATSNFVTINDIEIVKQDEFLTYELVSNSNSELVTASITNNRLKLEHVAGMVGSAEITVRVTDKLGAYIETTFNVVFEDTAPEATVSLSPSAPAADGILTATATKQDDDGDPVTLSYEWSVNDEVVKTTENSPNLTDQLDLSTLSNLMPGDVVKVKVTPNDGNLDGDEAMAMTQINRAPAVTSVDLSTDSPTTNAQLTATVTANDQDGDSISFTYIWKVNDVVVQSTLSTPNLTSTLDLSSLGQGDKGDVITVEVTASDGKTTSATETATATVVNSAPTVPSLELAPESPTTESVLIATISTADDDDDGVTVTYVWKIDDVEVRRLEGTGNLMDELDLSTLAEMPMAGSEVTVEVTPFDGTVSGETASASKTLSAVM